MTVQNLAIQPVTLGGCYPQLFENSYIIIIITLAKQVRGLRGSGIVQEHGPDSQS